MRLLLTVMAVATLASCQKESLVDSTITSAQEIKFTPYAGASNTKGTPVNTNADFAGTNNAFKVAAYSGTANYFGFNTVTYNTNKWTNTDKMYWPNVNSTLHFGAYYPATATFSTAPAYSFADNAHALTFGYTVPETVNTQVDLMFATSDYDYNVPAGTEDEDKATAPLHFKHALTQVGFKATKDADINVTVSGITICNVVDNGTFTATLATTDTNIVDTDNNGEDPSGVDLTNFGTWSLPAAAAQNEQGTVTTNLKNFAAALTSDNVTVGTTSTQLTSTTDVLMLLPQPLTAWNPTATTDTPNNGTESYLAIKCKITHNDGEAAILNGTIYVPIDTKDIPYTSGDNNDVWKAGHKITYNLNFGGGYTIPGEPNPEGPKPGETPKPEEVVPTLRPITYTVTVDEWIPVDGGPVTM